MGKKLSKEEIINRIKKVHGNKVQIDFLTFKNISSTCKFIDEDYGEFWNNPYNVYACGQGHRQRFIEEKLKKPIDHIQKQIDKIHNGKIKIIKSTYTGSDKKCKFIDEDYGEFEAYPFNTIHYKQRHSDYQKSLEYKRNNPKRKIFKLSDEECLQKDTPRRNKIKQLVLKNKLLKYICKECNQEPTWKEKPLTLELHHINGDCSDNRIENLCFLCPNCHTQTPTYRGRK